MERIAGGDADAIVLARLRDLTDSVAELGGLLRRLHDAGGSLVALDFRIDTSTEAGMRAARALIEVGDWERARILEQSRPGLAAARAKRRFAEDDSSAGRCGVTNRAIDRLAHARAGGPVERVVRRDALAQLLLALDFGVELGAEQQRDLGQPDPPDEHDGAGERPEED